MRWLVDGMNLIGSRPDRWWEDRDRAIEELTEELERYASASGDDVAVVFDSRPKGRRTGKRGPVEVQFGSGERDAADRIIVRTVRRDASPESLRVVTSDRALRRDVEASGAAVVSVTAFRRRLSGQTRG